MKSLLPALLLAAAIAPAAEIKSGPPLPHKVVRDWAKLPDGWNFGETSGVSVDAKDNVWVFNRGAHPVIQFNKDGKFLQSWGDGLFKATHGIRVDNDGNIWTIDVKGHKILKLSPQGKILMAFGNPGGVAGSMDTPYAYNEPTSIAFAPGGDFFVSDGYLNARVLHYSKDGEFLKQWGSKGTGEGQFDLVHDVTLDSQGRVYIADRTNSRVQVFDKEGKFLNQWRDVGTPWGLFYVKKENALYMCDGVNNRIVKLNTDGQILGVLSSFGKTQGKLDFAHHIAVDSEGSIYVAEIKNWRVQKFQKP